jgi:disulfide bond formation protein DsbB
VQRGFFYALLVLFLLGAIQNPGKRGTTVYSVLLLVFAIGGGAVATRQVWLQHLPKDRVPACGPDLFFMLKNFPLGDAISRLFAGSGECAAVDWTFLGGSIAEWSLACFCALALYSVWLAARRTASAPARA